MPESGKTSEMIEVPTPEQPAAAGSPSGQQAPAVRVAGLRKSYGDVTALTGVELAVAPGEFFTLLGPSGSGMTTLLRLIAGFERPDAGTIELTGADVTGTPPYARDVNTVFQDYALFPHMTVAENIEYGLRVKRVPRQQRQQQVAQALEMVRLPGLGARKPSQLSGGQRQRVALARAIVNRPQVLLLDEPLGALDLKLRQEMQLELLRVQREVGITFVYVTHDQEEALTMSDRIAVMSNGVVEQVDTPENVYERPATTFVAGFIGVSNLMPGTVTSATGGRGVIKLDTGLEVETRVDGLAAGERCHAVVRPEKLRIADPGVGTPGGLPGVDGMVQASVYLGTSTQIIVALPGDVSMTVLVPNASEAERARLPGGGAPVRLSWEPDHMHVVRESEVRPVDVEETVLA
jgi:spermidine/putrescine ABC transporter ATP-binding subunit